MRSLWLGLWLLSASWLFGLDYFYKGSVVVWAILVALGALLVCWSQIGTTGAAQSSESKTIGGQTVNFGPAMSLGLALLFFPALFLLSGPARLAAIFLIGGAILALVPPQRRRVAAISSGVWLTGIILLGQTVALASYKHFTAHSHELPWPLPEMLAAFVRLLGVGAAADGSDLVLPTMRETHRLAATWELLIDPATFCFLAGGAIILLFSNSAESSEVPRVPEANSAVAHPPKTKSQETRPESKTSGSKTSVRDLSRRFPWLADRRTKALGLLLLAGFLWLPARLGLHVGLFLHRALRTDFEAPLDLMNQFWSPWPQLALLLPLALVLSSWMRGSALGRWVWSRAPISRAVLWRSAGISLAATAVLTLAVLWDPVGHRKSGRIVVDEFHSKWEPTDRPMDTKWYGHLSGYNYACLYDFCSRHYEMSRLTNSVTDATLANVDVLIAKVPTEPFQAAEVDVITRFVERGGGLLLVGEHTDVFNTGYHLNQLARRFGFEFRYDCLFGMESFFDEAYEAPPWRHPILQYVRAFDFATSCSLDVHGRGRGVIVSTGLKNSMADYHANNYYPQAVDHAAMRSGAFVQLWSARHGKGRIVAFTDSTIFSNFSTFEPGKIELLLGMIEWLNHQDGIGDPRIWLGAAGLLLLAWTFLLGVREIGSRPWLVGAGVLGWSVTCLLLMAYQRHALPMPKPSHPLTWVTIDRTVCDGPLSKGGFIAGKADGFGIFERWILRLGYFIRRRSGPSALEGDLVVLFYPTKPVPAEFRQALIRYVEGGGRVLILDSPKNERSTAAALLEPFGLSAKPFPGGNGNLTGPLGWPVVPIDATYEITGGKTLFRVNDRTVGAMVRRGQGSVVALGFGSRFSDGQMGVTGDVVPDEKLQTVFNLEFTLLRAIIGKEVEVLSQ